MTTSSPPSAPFIPGTNIPASDFIDSFVKGFNFKTITKIYPKASPTAIRSALRKAGHLYREHLLANDLNTIVPAIQKELAKLQGVELALMFGSTASGDARMNSDINLMIVGNVESQGEVFGLAFIADLGRVVNVLKYTYKEWAECCSSEGCFEWHVLQQPIVLLRGRL